MNIAACHACRIMVSYGTVLIGYCNDCRVETAGGSVIFNLYR